MARGLCLCEKRHNSTFLLLNKEKQELNPGRPGKTKAICKTDAFHVTELGIPRHILWDFTRNKLEAPKQTALKDL